MIVYKIVYKDYNLCHIISVQKSRSPHQRHRLFRILYYKIYTLVKIFNDFK